MAKRFIDTELFNDSWFMKLSKDAKILWIYLITRCNHAGIIEINEQLLKIQTGIKSYLTVSKQLGNRIVTVREQYIFIPKFIYYQYPNFPNSKAKAQESAIEILKKFKLYANGKLTVKEELVNCYNNGNDKDNNNNKDKKIFNPPKINEVIDYFKEKGYTEQSAIRAFEYYDTANWQDSSGKKVKNWKQKMIAVWFKDENKIKKENSGKYPGRFVRKNEKPLPGTEKIINRS